jgi:hypothetical protein
LATAMPVHTETNATQPTLRPRLTRTGVAACTQGTQARRNSSVPFVPPKPKLFFTATSIFISRAVLAQ